MAEGLDAECFDAFLGSVCGEVMLRGVVFVDGGVVSVGVAAAVWTPRLFRRRRLRWLAGLFRRVYEVRVLREGPPGSARSAAEQSRSELFKRATRR